MSRARARRGNVIIFFALTLPVLVGFIALVVDIGHLWLVQSELQNAADAAALSGVRDLNGKAVQFPLARLSAQTTAGAHEANQGKVAISLNPGNTVDGNIVLGRWDYGGRTFTAADAAMPAYKVNAVQVKTHRNKDEGGSVALTFAQLFGVFEQDVGATAIAAGGSPESVCGFPLAVTDCSILQPDNSLKCNAALKFGQASTDNVGFTVFTTSNPTTPTVTCMMARQLKSPCPAGCDCAPKCNSTSTSAGEIKVSNGNNLSQTSVDNITNAVLAAGAAGLFVDVPVLESGLSPAACGSFDFNRTPRVAGYVKLKLTGATFAPNKSVTATVDCTHAQDGVGPPGGDIFEYVSKDVYLVK